MANTISQRTVYGGANTKLLVRSIHVISDGTEETDLVIYDNSAFAADVTKGKVLEIEAHGAYTGSLRFEFDAAADTPITSLGSNDPKICFRDIGGLTNPGGSGVTGDITLTTTTLANLDQFHILIYIDQS